MTVLQSEGEYYSPVNTSDSSYTTNPTAFIPSNPLPSGDLPGGTGLSARRGPSKAFSLLIAISIGAIALDLIVNRGKTKIHKNVPSSIAGSAAFEGIKAGLKL